MGRRFALPALLAISLGGLTGACGEEDDLSGKGGNRRGAGGGAGKTGFGGTAGSFGGTGGSSGFGASGGSAGSSAGAAGLGGGAGSGDVDGGSGAAGLDAGAGSGGIDGSAGSAAADASGGAAGLDGSAGGNTAGAAGGGSGGTSGGSGASGASGSAGTSGAAGSSAGGAAGTAGASGTAGTGGAAGADGGIAGTGGTAGIDAGSAGTSGTAGASGSAGTAGSSGASGADGGDGSTGSPNTAPGFTILTPPMGQPLDPAGATPLNPAPPAGWNWYPIQDAICRDGSPAGMFVKFTTSDKLFIYLEGGGACTNLGFCNFNPANVNSAISGSGETVLGSTLGVVAARQQPGVFELGVLNGIFDAANAANPMKDWNGVYIPYCTGDVHFGTRRNATVPGVTTQQQFVGYLNMQKFVGRIVPTFKDKISRAILTGASAGSFGAALNFSMFQDSFGSVRLDALLDSGVPFVDQYMPVCMQKRWRETWGLDAALPPDCSECRQADGGGMIRLADFLIRKHPNAKIAAVSSMQDEVIRLFFSMGLKNCSTFDTADPVGITLGQIGDPTIYFAAADYTAGLMDLRTRYVNTGRMATYYLGGFNIALHQHTWRARFTDPNAGTKTIAQFFTDFMNGTMAQIGP